MANTLYDIARRNLLAGNFTWAELDNTQVDTFKVCLVKTGAGNYTFSSTHTNMSQIAGHIANMGGGTANAIVSLANLYSTDVGAADADDVTFTQVTTGQTIGAIVIYKEVSGADQSQNPPLAYIDTATGLPITANGGDIIVTWDSGTNRIFRP